MAPSFILVTIALNIILTYQPVWMTQSKLPKVCTPHVGCIQGIFMPGYQSELFEAFLGIPYALPPIGELRFSNPKVYPRWTDVLNATTARTDCIQKNYLLTNPIVYGEEDCLYMNLYRPLNIMKNQPMPVMVYIHGGGWFSGSAGPALHGPEYFMDTKQVILVTFAYRLGAFGFLSTNDSSMPGNFGLKDQNLALRWVQKNIAAFGGNPKLVTIFGQSAGAISVHMHMFSKQSEGLFHNVISLSGTANVPFAITENPLAQTRRVAELCNISDALELSSTKLTRALRQVDALTLIRSGDGLKYWHVDQMTNFRPVVEAANAAESFLTQHPERLLESGNYKAVPWLVGGVPQEGAVRVLSILENATLKDDFNSQFDYLLEQLMDWPTHFNSTQMKAKTTQVIEEYFQGQHEINDATWQGFLDLITDRAFQQPFFKAVREHISHTDATQSPIFLYKFNYRGSYTYATIYTGGHSSRNYGVVHCDDLLYLFRSPLIFPDFAKDSVDAAVMKAFVENLVHFAKYSKPKSSELQRACNKHTFPELVTNTICDYQEFINDAKKSSFEIKTANEFNNRRMLLWQDLLEQ